MYVCTHADEYIHAHLHVYREQQGGCVSALCYTRTMPLCTYIHTRINTYMHIYMYTGISQDHLRQHIRTLLHKDHARTYTCTHTHTYMHTHLHAYKDKQRGFVPSRPLAVTQGPCPYTHIHTHT